MVKNTNLLAQTDHCQFFMYLSQQTFKIKINQTKFQLLNVHSLITTNNKTYKLNPSEYSKHVN